MDVLDAAGLARLPPQGAAPPRAEGPPPSSRSRSRAQPPRARPPSPPRWLPTPGWDDQARQQFTVGDGHQHIRGPELPDPAAHLASTTEKQEAEQRRKQQAREGPILVKGSLESPGQNSPPGSPPRLRRNACQSNQSPSFHLHVSLPHCMLCYQDRKLHARWKAGTSSRGNHRFHLRE